MEFLPVYFVPTVVFILGLIIGSFLDVIVCRFHTGKSINGRSRCLSCGHTLSWYELFPLLSYLCLCGRCLKCEGHIPLRLLATELLTAFLFLYVAVQTQALIALGFGLVLAAVLIVVVLYDYNHMVIPHEFVFALCALAVIFLTATVYTSQQMLTLVPFIISAIGSFLFYAGLWFVSKGRWIGLGDAKLAFALGLMLPPAMAFSMVVFSFWIGAVVSVLLLTLQRLARSGKKHLPFLHIPLTMKSEIPFAPFLVCSFILVFFGRIELFTLIAYLL